MGNSQKVVIANGSLMVDQGDNLATRVPIADNDPTRSTYSCFIPGFVPVATPTDFLQIIGSATRIVRIRSIVITGSATAASNILLATVRRSTSSTGTTTNIPLISRDTGDNAAAAIVQTFSANPALGTLIGVADGGRLNIAPAANGSLDRMALQYSWLNDKAPILRGPADCLCLNLAGAAWPAGGALDINIVLSEDTNASN
jgi:hypothetical protein